MSHPVSTPPWGVYLRISRTDDRLGVERQLEDCTDQLELMGADPSKVVLFDENNTSATKGLDKRPEYLRMMAEAEAGRIGGVIVYAQDRAWRDTDELSAFLKLADAKGIRLASSSTGEYDLRNPYVIHQIEVAGSAAKLEVRVAGRRIARASKQRAQAGKAHGRAPFGWRREVETDNGRVVASWDVLNEAEAGLLRHAAAELLAGRSLRAVAAEANRGEVRPREYTFGKGRYAGREAARTWSTQQLKTLLLRESNAGLRRHKGEVLEGVTAEWPPIFDVATYRQIVLLLGDPSRRANERGGTPSWLMSGIASCSVCPDGGKINVATGGTRGNPHYTCVGKPGAKGCFQRHPVAFVDQYIGDLVERRLADPDYGNAAPATKAAIDELYAQIDAERAEQAEAGKLQAAKLITLGQLVAINSATDARVAELEARIFALRPRTGRVELPGGWAKADLLSKRAVVRDLFERVELVPAAVAGKARRFETIADEVKAVRR